MSSTYSNLKFEIIGTGEQQGLWGQTTNTNIGTAIEQAIVGMATLEAADFTANVCTLTLSNTNAAQDARALCLNLDAAALSAAGTINVPAIQKPYIVINNTAHAVTVKVAGQTGVTVPAGKRTAVYNNGTDVGAQIDSLASLTLGAPLPVASGGTGLTSTPANGQLNIGNGTGFTRATLTAGSGISVTNSSGGITIASTVTPGTGTVTSVGGTGTVNGLTLTGTVTTSGDLTLGGALSGVNLASQVTGTLPVANGGTGLSTTPANGRLLIGNGTNYTLANLTQGSGISITNASGAITIAATGGGGTGDVVGPASSTDEAIATFNGTTGKAIKNNANWRVVSSTNSLSGTGSSPSLFLGSTGTFTVEGSSSTFNNRLRIVSASASPANETGIWVVPPSGGGGTAIACTSDTNVTNTSWTSLIHGPAAGSLVVGRNGSGSYLPMQFLTNNTGRMTIALNGNIQAGADNTQSMGTASFRWSEVFAATGTINTSDARMKTEVRAFTAQEIAAAKAMAKEIGAYKWLGAIANKGEKARSHIGLTVQRAIAIMEQNGLNPFDYGFICYDKWEASETTLPAAFGQPERKEVHAAGDGYSFRYDELNMFLARGFEARLAALEAL
jgi:hypothetical protein